jgi:hypothetical protein
MFPYLICFSTSSFLLWFGQNIKRGQSEWFRWFIYGIALLIPAALAGLRDFSIGVDTAGYGNPFFYDVVSSPSLDAVSPQWDGWIEPGYAWLNFIVAKFTDDVHWFYFVIMLLQNLFTFLGFYIYKHKLSIWLGMFCYYCIFFNYSLNSIRQCFALSIIFFASYYLLNKSYIKYAFCILITFLFHKVAILMFLFIPLHVYINKFESDRAKYFLITGVTIFFLLLETILGSILEILQLNNIQRAFEYLSSERVTSLKMAIGFFASIVPPVVFFYWKRKKLYDVGKENHFFLTVIVICLLSTQLMWIGGEFIGRIADPFKWFLMLALPMTAAIYKNSSGKQFLLKTSVACYAIYYWILISVYRNSDETIPYTSAFLETIF